MLTIAGAPGQVTVQGVLNEQLVNLPKFQGIYSSTVVATELT